MWNARILTLFPQIFPGPLGISVVGRALSDKKWSLETYDIKNYTLDKHKTVDDPPYGGGGGMVMRPDVLGQAIEKVFLDNKNPIIYLSPRGVVFNQQIALKYSEKSGLNILCGRFEGIDERIINEYMIEEVSLGDVLLSSGDVAAIPLIDACVRLLPGVVENEASLLEESFGLSDEYSGLLEYPHYTRPQQWKNHAVPEILLSGNHAAIKAWRLEKAKEKTKYQRPDLWKLYINGE